MALKLPYCGDLVRRHDPDRFLLSMFAPPAVREDIWALFAFNHEIAKTREVVSETRLGLIRLQWWREEIGKIYAGEAAAEHEVLQALAAAIGKHDLPQAQFETLLYAREFDLEDVRPGTLEGLLHYADFTTTPLMKLAVLVCGDDPETEPVQPVSVNYALAGILRAVVSHARQRRCYLPEDLMKREAVRLDRLYDLKAQEGLADIVRDVAGEIVPGVRPQNKVLKAAQALAMIYARQLRGVVYDPLHPRLQTPPAFKHLRLIFALLF